MIRDQIPLLLWGWAALSPLLFRLMPGRDAAMVCLVVGWAFLPVTPYPPSAISEAATMSSWHALAVPTTHLVNKAAAIGLGCLAGLLLFDRKTLGRLRFDRADWPMAVWCLVPLASSIANGGPLSEGLAQVRYLGLAWGVPYLIGRAYLTDDDSRARFAIAIAAGGLAYLPICVLEIVSGPTAYRLLYGPHPYEFEGAPRWLGYRPLGFMEHGNQLGIWMAGAAVSATWLWMSGIWKRIGGVPGWAAAASLVAATVLCQSHGSIILLGVTLTPLLIGRFARGRFPWKLAAAGVLAAAVLFVVLLAARRGFDLAALRLDVGGFFKGLNKSSLTWRFSRAEEFLPEAFRHRWLGSARADWREHGLPFVNPVNLPLWLLAFGMYGLVGLASQTVLWLGPPLRAASRRPFRTWFGPSGGVIGALVALAALNYLDSFSNSVAILPVVAALGGLNHPTTLRDTRN